MEDVQAIGELEHIRSLFTALETKEVLVKLLSMVDKADGVQIFIGSGNALFNVAGCSIDCQPVPERPGAHYRRYRGDRPDTHQLRPYHPDG